MKAVGIVAEYNPFHSGHWYQIRKIREIFGAETPVAAVMSGDFVQRGEAASYDKFTRAEAAVRGGVSLVIELPLPWSLSSAESFARGGGCSAQRALSTHSPSAARAAISPRSKRRRRCSTRRNLPEALKRELTGGTPFCRGARTGGACSSWRERGGARYAERSSGRGIHPRGGEARLYI